jgi:GNAT superfamily N-acetyltransferase
LDQDQLARLEHDNLIAALTKMCANANGALVRSSDGVAVVLTGSRLRLFNQVLVASDEAADEAIDGAVAVARERGDRFIVNLRDGFDDSRLPLIERLGLVPVSEHPWMPGMALQPIAQDVAQPPSDVYDIRQVTGDRGVDDHIRTAAAGFELPEDVIRTFMNTATARDPDVAVYVGYAEGAPVTSGLGFRTGRTIGVYNIATVAAARGRGYGATMTKRVANDGARAGCDVAILQASEMGLPIYERLGYRTVVQYRGYVEPSSLTPG